MKKHAQGFSLIELLLAMTISSFVIMGMMQGVATAHRFFKRAQDLMALNRRTCLAFNQLERDFNTAIIPIPAKSQKEQEEEHAKSDAEKKNKQEDRFTFFQGNIYDDAAVKVAGKKYELFKNITMVCTNPFKVYNERRPNFVRVLYELVLDKEKKQGTKVPYKLLRKECLDLKNKMVKEPETIDKKDKAALIKTDIIADNIKEFSVEYVVPRPKEKGNVEEGSTEKRSFVWGKKEAILPHAQKKNEVTFLIPQYVEIRIVFYDDTLQDAYPFETMCQIVSFSIPEAQKSEEKEKP